MARLGDALGRTSATLHTEARVEHLVVEDGRVVGLTYRHEGSTLSVKATGGVVLGPAGSCSTRR